MRTPRTSPRHLGLGVLPAVALAALLVLPLGARAREPGRPFRILHVMSYHAPWRWTDGQLEGFKEGLGDAPAEFRVFQMDSKRRARPEEKERAGREARALIDGWKPDLVYTTDDDAQEYVVKPYLNQDLPFVFSGVNRDPAAYGFTGSRNVTGVLEQEHFVASVELLRQIAPKVRRIAVVLDGAPMWAPVRARMEQAAPRLAGVVLGPWDTVQTFEDYKRKLQGYQGTVDAVALVGIFGFKDAGGRDVPYQEVLRWTAEHSPLPDLSFWVDRVHFGTLCAVTVSEREQGLAAGRLARAILVEGRSPASLPMRPTTRGLPVVNLARARALGLMPPTGVLLTAEVVKRYEWDER
jgi:ABC-type uncharacterized transport system substrate-binding protein